MSVSPDKNDTSSVAINQRETTETCEILETTEDEMKRRKERQR